MCRGPSPMPDWKHRLTEVRPAMDRLHDAIMAEKWDEADAAMKIIGAEFGRHMTDSNAASSERDAQAWMADESPKWWAENESVWAFYGEFNHRLDELYDWADANRVWVALQTGAPAHA